MSTAGTMMVLSAIAYESNPHDIARSVANNVPGWTVAWGPCGDGENLAYVALDPAESNYVVVIRGTNPDDVLAYDRILQAKTIYADHGGPKCPLAARVVVDALQKIVKQHSYTQPGDKGRGLSGTLQNQDSYTREIGAQHSHLMYLRLLGTTLK